MIPTDPKSYAKFEQAASVEYAQFDPIAAIIVWERLVKPHIGQTTNEERVKELITQLDSKLDGYEAILGGQKYLAGEVRSICLDHVQKNRSDEQLVQELTLADLFHLPNASLVFERLKLGSLEKRPNIQRQGIYPSMEVLDF